LFDSREDAANPVIRTSGRKRKAVDYCKDVFEQDSDQDADQDAVAKNIGDETESRDPSEQDGSFTGSVCRPKCVPSFSGIADIFTERGQAATKEGQDQGRSQSEEDEGCEAIPFHGPARGRSLFETAVRRSLTMRRRYGTRYTS
jgi:hypothetical protein